MAGQTDGFVGDAFHQAAVAGDDPGAVVHQAAAEPGGQQALGERHADGGGDALAERAGGGFDGRVLAEFGVAGGGGVQLAELLELLDFHAGMAGQVQQRIKQHGAVAGGKHEAVTIGPARVGGIKFMKAGPQHGGDVGHAHGHAGMAGIGFLDGVDGEGADGVGERALGRGGARQDGGLGCQSRVVSG